VNGRVSLTAARNCATIRNGGRVHLRSYCVDGVDAAHNIVETFLRQVAEQTQQLDFAAHRLKMVAELMNEGPQGRPAM
jgi:hypothetical protein